MMNKHKTIPIFVSHMGCPNSCSFCDQNTITGHAETVTPEKAKKIIETALSTLAPHTDCEIGFFGGSFTGIEPILQESLLEVAQHYVEKGSVKRIRLSTRPDYVDHTVIERLLRYQVSTVELGAQSMCDAVLLQNRRGHKAKDTENASRLIKQAGLKLGLQMMTGLLGDCDETCLESAEKIIDLSPDMVRIYPTLVLKDTYLEALYRQGLYSPQTLEDAVSLCADLKRQFDTNNIPVIRMGLLASDQISPEHDVVAGPFHPAFGELVQSRLFYRELKQKISENSTVLVHPKSVSAFVGNRRENIKSMESAGIFLRVEQDESVPVGAFRILKQKGGRVCG